MGTFAGGKVFESFVLNFQPFEVEDVEAERDPLRAAADRLRIELISFPDGKFPKPERELLAFLELHPGSHNLAQVGERVKNASESARALARKQVVTLVAEHPLGGLWATIRIRGTHKGLPSRFTHVGRGRTVLRFDKGSHVHFLWQNSISFATCSCDFRRKLVSCVSILSTGTLSL